MPAKIDFDWLYEHAACGLISFHLDKEITYANQTMLTWLGLEQEEIQNKKLLDILDTGQVLYYNLFVLPMLQMQREVNEISLQIKSSKGSFPALFSASVMNKDASGNPIVNASIIRISDRKKYETELLKRKKKAEDEKKERDEALKEIAFEQAHLVRAPLANILGLISLMDGEFASDDDQKSILKLLKESTMKLDDVIKNIVYKT